jgi:quercetin dioxygenase-like cupin family protein
MNMDMNTETLGAPGCKRTTVQKLHDERGLQILRVDVEPGGEIPLHEHDCAATMVILEGTARALGKGERVVQKGDVVVKTPHEPHGFTDISGRFSFISLSTDAGIVRPDRWDMTFV